MNTFASLTIDESDMAAPVVVYDSTRPSDFDPQTNSCSGAQKKYLRDAVAQAGPNSISSLLNTDVSSDVYVKWFGKGVTQKDSDVITIMRNASDMMDKMENLWDPVCCNNGTSGTCFACGDSTLAFVTSYSYRNDDTKYSNTWVRFCPNFW